MWPFIVSFVDLSLLNDVNLKSPFPSGYANRCEFLPPCEPWLSPPSVQVPVVTNLMLFSSPASKSAWKEIFRLWPSEFFCEVWPTYWPDCQVVAAYAGIARARTRTATRARRRIVVMAPGWGQ